MNLNREAAQAAEADPAVAVSDAAAPAADVREVAVTVAVKAAEAVGREVTISDAGRRAVARMASHQDSSSVPDSNRATQKIANRRCRRFQWARRLDKSRWRR